MVQAGAALLPGADAAIVRVRLGGRERLLAIANDCNNRYCYLNPRRGGQIAVVECLRNLACAGAHPLGMTNNLNFGNPYKPENFYHDARGRRRPRRSLPRIRRARRRRQCLPV